ncbi:sulfatase [Flammeovirgaceae bacterium SG7u.111]|nr:sulfatase [Flammeovirgaceae bacterium SG7u.132]WPO34547.1 sulfatase [Flammeovirgaceae bacterium SG7u.111]
MKSYYQLFILFISINLFACQPEKEEAKRPNILFCIADDATFAHMGAYGCSWVKTPGFDRVAQEGVLFMNAYTPNAKCAPSRSCILTGRNSWQLEEAANHVPFFPTKFTTYAETLKQNGYHVGYTAKGWAPGIALDSTGDKRELTGKVYNEFKLTPPTSKISSIDYTANFEAFLKDRKEGEPFCFWYGSTEPHRAYEFMSGVEKGGKKLSDIDEVPAFWPDTDSVRHDMLDYAYEIEYFDQHLSAMIELLEKNGELENTLIVVTADNGMPFPRVKGNKYEFSNHLPLAIMWPAGIKGKGRKVEDFVSFIDFTPTFLEVAGVTKKNSRMQPIQGKSLTDILYTAKEGIINPARDHVLLGKERHDLGRPNDWGYPVRGIVKGKYLYLHNFETSRWPSGNPETGYMNTDGGATKSFILNDRRTNGHSKWWDLNFGKRLEEELYDIENDPYCIHNLAIGTEMSEVKNNLKQQLFKELEEQEDPRILGDGQVFDTYIYSQENVRGYYERYMSGEDVKAGWINETDYETAPLD